MATDVLGLIIAVVVTAASVHDNAIGIALLDEVAATAPTVTKSWVDAGFKQGLLPIVTLTYGYAITGKSLLVALLGCLAVLVFGVLDANYLRQERAFRKLYDEVAAGRPIPAFSANPTLASPAGARANYWPDKPDMRSWAVAPVHAPLMLAGFGIVVWLLCQ
ncbi:hypothetical protein [Streptomyces sp. YIM S03343]